MLFSTARIYALQWPFEAYSLCIKCSSHVDYILYMYVIIKVERNENKNKFQYNLVRESIRLNHIIIKIDMTKLKHMILKSD